MKLKMKLLGLPALILASLQSSAVLAEPVTGVVELFTSQGCSSCPPADKVLGQLSKNKNILTLSWHVDYWDYIGWKDTFADEAYTQRQWSYARHQKERMVYTPQAMINGRTHMNGGAAKRISSTLVAHHSDSSTSLPVSVDLVRQDGEILLKLDEKEINGSENQYSMSLIRFKREEEVEISRGENTGKTLTYHNIVRDVDNLAMWKGEAINMVLPSKLIGEINDDTGLAVIVQSIDANGSLGPIAGAAQLLN